MRFLADESCDGRVVERLRDAGYDVVTVSSMSVGATDVEVTRMAIEQGRILITEDKDFGQFFFASGRPGPGVILLRIPVSGRSWLLNAIASIIANRSGSLAGNFLVVEPGRTRLSSSKP